MEEVSTRAKGKEDFGTVEELAMLADDKRSTSVKSCKERTKKEPEVLVITEEFVFVGKTDEHMKRGLRQLPKNQQRRRKKAAKELVEAVKDRRQQLEDEEWKKMEDYIFFLGPDKRRSRTPNAKIWQIVQSSNAEAENEEHDFTEIVGIVQEPRSGEPLRNSRFAGKVGGLFENDNGQGSVSSFKVERRLLGMSWKSRTIFSALCFRFHFKDGPDQDKCE